MVNRRLEPQSIAKARLEVRDVMVRSDNPQRRVPQVEVARVDLAGLPHASDRSHGDFQIKTDQDSRVQTLN